MKVEHEWSVLRLPDELSVVLERCPSVSLVRTVQELVDLACGGPDRSDFRVEYDLPDGRTVCEATVARVRNGIVVNYPEPAMRRRDPDCMLIADDKPSDKPRYRDRFGEEFDEVRRETLEWLAAQDLALFGFHTGRPGMGDHAVAVAPRNAAFFALGLALLQGIMSESLLDADFEPQAIIYVAPPFRHTHFGGKQVVVHNRLDEVYEMFSYNLYPGPSAKKGVYGMLIGRGEEEGWVTAHCSTVQVTTPYDNTTIIMHEGASGGGKSEMLELAHRLPDGRLLLGRNVVTNEERYLEITRLCDLAPVTDDMALCHPNIQQKDGKLWVTDAENAWFLRVNHIDDYGKDPYLEKLTARPPCPLLFLNVDAVPGSRAMIWEHTMDAPDRPCPNPRVIIPRSIAPNVVNEPVAVDIRSFGVRTPPCTRENPNYGILGILHILPPALAWLWRLAAPRGHGNPSIIGSDGLSSEGVGSYWPFATGRKVIQANLLLQQIVETPRVRYILVPNQHVGAWEMGFMPQWIAREYLARRGSAKFKEGQVVPARCPLLGYAMFMMRVEGTQIPHWLLEVNQQLEVGDGGYDRGAEMLTTFFRETVRPFLDPDLSNLGRRIIECFMDGGSVQDYEAILPR
jgi:hypothetical protein